jgi:hypothetical protein
MIAIMWELQKGGAMNVTDVVQRALDEYLEIIPGLWLLGIYQKTLLREREALQK